MILTCYYFNYFRQQAFIVIIVIIIIVNSDLYFILTFLHHQASIFVIYLFFKRLCFLNVFFFSLAHFILQEGIYNYIPVDFYFVY